MAINYFGEARMKQLLALIKGQLDLKAAPADIAKAITDANLGQYALSSDLTAAVARITANEGDIDTIQETLKKVATAEGLASLQSDVNTIKGDYLKAADKAELEGKISAAVSAHDESDAAHAALFRALNDKMGAPDTGKTVAGMAKDAAAAAAAAQGDVDALEGKVGTVAEGKTVVQMIEEAQAAATYDDTALAGRVSTLEGSDAGKSVRAISAEEATKAINTFATQVSDDNVVNSFKELVDWAASHGSEAAEMAAAIQAIQAVLAGIGGEGEKPTVVAYVTDAISALKIGDYAKAADLTALAGRVTTLEGKSHVHANAEELEKIAAGDKAKWDAAEQNAKAYADGLAKNYDASGSAAQALADAKSYADQVSSHTEYTEAEVTAMWNAVFTA